MLYYWITYTPFSILTAFGALFGSPAAVHVIPVPVKPSIVISVMAAFIASQMSDALISGVIPFFCCCLDGIHAVVSACGELKRLFIICSPVSFNKILAAFLVNGERC